MVAPTYTGIGGVATSTTSVTPAQVAGQYGDLILNLCFSKVPTAGGPVWRSTNYPYMTKLIEQVSTVGTATGAGAGKTRAAVFMYEQLKALAPNFTDDVSDVHQGVCVGIRGASKTMYWDIAAVGGESTVGSDTTPDFVLGSVDLQPDDFILIAGCDPQGTSAKRSAEAIAASGITFSAVTEIHDAGTANGTDLSSWAAWCTVTAGSGNVVPTVSLTSSNASTYGPCVLIRVRGTALVTTSLAATRMYANVGAVDPTDPGRQEAFTREYLNIAGYGANRFFLAPPRGFGEIFGPVYESQPANGDAFTRLYVNIV